MKGHIRQWVIDVIGQEEYDRLTNPEICIDEPSYCSTMQTFDNIEESCKKTLRQLFYFIATGRIYLRLYNGNAFQLYHTRYVQTMGMHVKCYLEKRGICRKLALSPAVDGYYVICLPSSTCLEFHYVGEKESIVYVSRIVHPKDMKKRIDDELDKNLYSLPVYKERRAKCRKSVIYFMAAFRKVFSRNICTKIGKMVYETSKNDYSWENIKPSF